MKQFLFKYHCIGFIFLMGSKLICAQDFSFKFIFEKNKYSVEASFPIQSDQECLLTSIFNPEGLINYSPGVEKIRTWDKTDSSYFVYFLYERMFFFQSESIWKRNLVQDELRIDFFFISDKNNRKIIPSLISSTGYYLIIPMNGFCIVKYYQTAHLKDKISNSKYIREAKKEGVIFLELLQMYLEDAC